MAIRVTFLGCRGFMLDVIVDGKVADVRERAQQGNLDSMVLLATYIQKGMHTRQNKDQALSILNYVLARKEEIPFKETYWNAINQKIHIHFDRGERVIIDRLALELVRHMVTFPPNEWDYEKLFSAIDWINVRREQGCLDLPEFPK